MSDSIGTNSFEQGHSVETRSTAKATMYDQFNAQLYLIQQLQKSCLADLASPSAASNNQISCPHISTICIPEGGRAPPVGPPCDLRPTEFLVGLAKALNHDKFSFENLIQKFGFHVDHEGTAQCEFDGNVLVSSEQALTIFLARYLFEDLTEKPEISFSPNDIYVLKIFLRDKIFAEAIRKSKPTKKKSINKLISSINNSNLLQIVLKLKPLLQIQSNKITRKLLLPKIEQFLFQKQQSNSISNAKIKLKTQSSMKIVGQNSKILNFLEHSDFRKATIAASEQEFIAHFPIWCRAMRLTGNCQDFEIGLLRSQIDQFKSLL